MCVCAHKIGEYKKLKEDEKEESIQTDWIDTVALNTHTYTRSKHFIVLLRIRSVNNNKEKRKSGDEEEEGESLEIEKKKKPTCMLCIHKIVTSKLMYGCRCT